MCRLQLYNFQRALLHTVTTDQLAQPSRATIQRDTMLALYSSTSHRYITFVHFLLIISTCLRYLSYQVQKVYELTFMSGDTGDVSETAAKLGKLFWTASKLL